MHTDFSKYQIKEIEFTAKTASNKRFALNSQLSPDGRYIISREYEIIPERQDVSGRLIYGDIVFSCLSLHDLKNGRNAVLFGTESAEVSDLLFASNSPFSNDNETLYMLDSGKIFYSTVNGYKLCHLK